MHLENMDGKNTFAYSYAPCRKRGIEDRQREKETSDHYFYSKQKMIICTVLNGKGEVIHFNPNLWVIYHLYPF